MHGSSLLQIKLLQLQPMLCGLLSYSTSLEIFHLIKAQILNLLIKEMCQVYVCHSCFIILFIAYILISTKPICYDCIYCLHAVLVWQHSPVDFKRFLANFKIKFVTPVTESLMASGSRV